MKRVQGSSNETAQLTGEAFRYAIGIDMASGTADEAAERALSAVRRKLDITMTVEYTVNELIAEATDLGNLATMFHGENLVLLYIPVFIMPSFSRMDPVLLTPKQ